MKFRTHNKKKRAAALITVATLILALLFTACPNAAGGSGSGGGGGNSGGGGGTPVPPADKTYTVDGVSFTMKGIAAVTDGTVGYTGITDNQPHTVSLTAYLIGETEVTQELWQAVMSTNPSGFNSNHDGTEVQEKRPVERVNWYQAIAFCNELTKKVTELGPSQCVYTFEDHVYDMTDAAAKKLPDMDMSKKGFRLPTEAEWEWAAKGGTENKWAGTDTESELVNYAWYKHTGEGNANDKTHEVKKKLPNGYGLYDMSGNVWEWCWDWYKNDTPTGGQDSIGADSGTMRVWHGGCCLNIANSLAHANRLYSNPDNSYNVVGFRLASRPESGGGSSTPAYVRVPYTKLAGYLNTASATDLHYIEVTGVTNNDLNGSGPNPSLLGQIIKGSGKKVALKLPAEITEIKLIAFIRCTGLERVDLSACTGLTKIDDSAFRECTDLKSVDLSGCAVLSEIGADAFRDCGGLTQVDLSGCTGPITIGNLAFANCPIETLAIDCAVTGTIITKLTQEVSVKANLKNLKLGAGVTKIGANAFEECKALKSVNLADHASLTDIGESAFAECTALESIDLSDCTSLTQIDEGTFAGCSLLPSVDLSGCTSLATIGITAFSGCTALKSIDLSGCTNLTAINDDAFENCSLLPSVDLSGCTSLATIGDTVFSGCTKAVIKLPESIVTIGDSAFGSAEASWCKKVLIKSGAEYDRIKGLVTGLGYPADRIGSY